ncbi:MAG: transposase, partial [bacterium]|nr:transposase [bacterium]
MSPMKVWRICNEELKKLPNNNEFTFKYCDRFSQILVCDGKYFNVANQDSDWVLLWGFDYFRHDIPVITIAPSENYQAWARFFAYFRIINNYPRLVVCDDCTNEKMAARATFPGVKIQTCYNHFKENIRRNLKVRSDEHYHPFMKRIEEVLTGKRTDEDRNKKLFGLYRDYQTDPVCVTVLTNIAKYTPELLAYRGIPQAPVTSNIIEGMNSHIEARLHSLRSFQTVEYAKLWFNGYILKRRFSKYT